MQFSDAVDDNGEPAHRIGTTGGLLFNLEGCFECGVSGWGWSGGSWWSSETQHVQFATGGRQTLRVQTREDGVQIDQVILSPSTYLHARPGDARNDGAIPANADDQNSSASETPPSGEPDWVAPTEPAGRPAAPTGDGGNLRVMTWNIHFGHGDTWGQARAIADSGADVVLLQEAQTWDEHMPTTYAERLGQLTGQQWHSLWAAGDDCGGGCQGTLILSRLPIVDSSVAVFDGTPVGRAVIDVGGVHVNVFNVHLEYYDSSRRSSQLHQLMDWTRQFGGPRLVGGDFNSWWGEYWIHQMETEYSDTWQDVTGSDENGYTLNGSVRFDYLFRAYQENHRLTPEWGEVRHTGLSDHEPFVAHYTVR
jgi:endonuclease/exonuclease/phosphatase family metal-dependent hydrolase